MSLISLPLLTDWKTSNEDSEERLNIYYLDNNQYSLVNTSQLLPHLNLNLLTQFIDHPNPRMAIKEFRKLLENE